MRGFVIAALLAVIIAGLPYTGLAQGLSADFSDGSVIVGTDSRTCDSNLEGSLRYNSLGGPISGLVGYWKLDETSGSTITDNTASNDGSWQDGTDSTIITEGVSGQIDGALDFDRTDSAYILGGGSTSTDIDDLGAMSVCFWGNIDSGSGSWHGMVAKSGGGANGWSLYQNGNGYGFHTNYGGEIETTTTVNYGNWQHVCATWDGNSGFSGIKIYLDGTEDTAGYTYGGGGFTSDASYDLNICRDANNASYFCDGQIDDVRIYDRVLTASEIAELYNYNGSGTIGICGLGGGSACQNIGDVCDDGSIFAGDTDLYVMDTYVSGYEWKTLGTDGTWRWYGGDLDTVQFWNGGPGGSTGNYANWDSGNEPGGGTNEACLQFWGTGTPNPNSWNDEKCDHNDAYICEKDGPAADCSGLGNANINNGGTGHCYYREDSTTYWMAAKQSCESNSAHLATVADQTENDYIYNNLMSGISTAWLGGTDGYGADDINPDSLSDGAANHTNRSGTLSNFPAMEYCENLTRHSQTDWYLPSKNELNTLYTNSGSIGGWAGSSNEFWSSSEDGTFAWGQNIDDGTQKSVSKEGGYVNKVRCVRRGSAPVTPSYDWWDMGQ